MRFLNIGSWFTLNCFRVSFRGPTWLKPKLVLMGGRVSGYDTVAGMWRPGGANPFEGRFRRGAPAVGASETKPYVVRGLYLG